MAHNVNLNDGSTTISLTSSGIILLSWHMQPPDIRQVENLLGGDGGSLSRPSWTNVTESIEILISGVSAQAIRDKGNDIERMLNTARESRRVMSLRRVFIRAQVADEAAAWRSEILSGRLVWDEPLDNVVKLNARATLIITRRYFFEGPEVALQLSTLANSTPTTSAVTLHNDHDQTTNNYINIAGAQVTGQVPAPLRLKLTNAEAGAVHIENLYIANTTHIGTTSMFRRGAQSTISGENFSSGSSNNVLAYYWTLTDAQLAALNGRYARVIVAFSGSYDGYIQTGLRYGTEDVYRNEQVKSASAHMIDVGSMPIGGVANLPSPTAIAVALFLQKAGGMSTSLRYMHMMPAGEGIFRRLYLVGTLPAGWSIVDDGIDGIVYEQDNTGNGLPTVYPFHTPLHLWPGQQNRLRVLYHTATGLGAGNALTVQAWFRPRRLTL